MKPGQTWTSAKNCKVGAFCIKGAPYRSGRPLFLFAVQKTFFTRLRLSADQSELFEQLGLIYGGLKHALYREVAVGGGKCMNYKNAFLVEHSITARQFCAAKAVCPRRGTPPTMRWP